MLADITCTRPIGHGGTHWSKELTKEAYWNSAGDPPSMTEPVANTPQPDPTEFEEWAKQNGYDVTRAKSHSGYRHSSTVYAEIGWLAARRLSPDRKLVEALEWYTNKEAYHEHAEQELGLAWGKQYTPVLDDAGKKARAALKTQEPAPKERR